MVRPAHKEDFSKIYTVNELAFKQHDEAQLVERLRKSQEYIMELEFVAIKDHQIVGHILYTTVQIGHHVCRAVALAPMSVLPTFQNQGIGASIIRHTLQEVNRLGYSSVIVLGHPNYYPRFGFRPASNWGIQFHQDVPDDVFMALSFDTNGLNGISGIVKYSDAFDL